MERMKISAGGENHRGAVSYAGAERILKRENESERKRITERRRRKEKKKRKKKKKALAGAYHQWRRKMAANENKCGEKRIERKSVSWQLMAAWQISCQLAS
jgi:hypothetical protein